jgi:integrase
MEDKRQFCNEKHKLLRIAEETDIFDSKKVTDYIMTLRREDQQPTSAGYRQALISTYQKFCQYNQIPFDRPRIEYAPPIPLIPRTVNVEKIINNSSPDYATIFKILAETGIEGAELHRTHQNSIDRENGTISIKGCKGHDNGIGKLKPQTTEMLRQYLARHQDAYPFPKSRSIGEAWRYYRKDASQKLCEPDLMKIPLKSLRNYAGAIHYLTKGKDPIGTQRFMRHKLLSTTQHYLKAIILDEEEEYITGTVQLGTETTKKEITELLDAGYQYVTDADGYKYFRKRK